MQPGPGDERCEDSLVDDRRRLGPAHGQRILPRPEKQVVGKEQDDEVQQQSGHHLVDAELQLQDHRQQKQQAAGQRPRQKEQWDHQKGGQRNEAGAEVGGGQGPGIELALAADVPELGAEGHRGCETGEDQRSRPGEGFTQCEDRAEGTVQERAIGGENRSAGPENQ